MPPTRLAPLPRATMQRRSSFPSPVLSLFARDKPSKIVRTTSPAGSDSTAMLKPLADVDMLPNDRLVRPATTACAPWRARHLLRAQGAHDDSRFAPKAIRTMIER